MPKWMRKIVKFFKKVRQGTNKPYVQKAALVDTSKNTPATTQYERKRLALDGLLAKLSTSKEEAPISRRKLQRYIPAPGVIPQAQVKSVLACDSTPYDYINAQAGLQYTFPGYPYLAELTQVSEYRKMGSRTAEEMTRKWIEIKTSGEGDFSEEIAQLNQDFDKFKLADLFRTAAEKDAWLGRCQLYIDVKTPGGVLASDDTNELSLPLFMDPKKITKGCLQGFRIIEPTWSYPGMYNSTDPLKADYYEAQTWYVMGKEVHASRLLMFIGNPVPDMLKAAYAFGGISMSQLAQPYVNNWLRTRDSVSDVVHSFSICGLATDLSAVLEGAVGGEYDANGNYLDGAGDVFKRVEMFAKFRDNRSAFITDKETEEFFQFSTPLGGLDALQAQSQEHMSSVSSMPLVILTGITPSGLNATSEGEIRVFYDYIHSRQERLFKSPLDVIFKVLQLNRFGKIIPELVWEFVPLFQLSQAELMVSQKTQADMDVEYIEASVFSAEEIRVARSSDPDSAYSSIKDTGEDDDDKEAVSGAQGGSQGAEGVERDTEDTRGNSVD